MPKKSAYSAWASASIDAWALGMEASSVIGLRMARIAMGGVDADKECRLMVAEKMEAAWELQMAMMTGGLGTTPLSSTTGAIRHYRRKVKANRRRLG